MSVDPVWSRNSGKPFYSPGDLSEVDYASDLGDPGSYPFTRGSSRHGFRPPESGKEAPTMIDFGSARFRDRLQEALSRHEGFALETRWFDGSILLEADESRCWLKVYRGRIVEALDSTPPFGSTFRLRGSRQAWEELVSGQRRFADLIMPGQRRFENDPSLASANGAAPPRIAIEGNLLEATRIYEALFHLADCVAQIAK